MRHLLFVTLENAPITNDIIIALSKEGYNGTVLSSTSVNHVLQDEEEEDALSFISLAHLHEKRYIHNTTIYFILEDDKLKEVQEKIREKTEHFTLVKGGMFSSPIESYEGSF